MPKAYDKKGAQLFRGDIVKFSLFGKGIAKVIDRRLGYVQLSDKNKTWLRSNCVEKIHRHEPVEKTPIKKIGVFSKASRQEIQANKFSSFRHPDKPAKRSKRPVVLRIFFFKVADPYGNVIGHGEAKFPNAKVGIAILSQLNPLAAFIHVRKPND